MKSFKKKEKEKNKWVSLKRFLKCIGQTRMYSYERQTRVRSSTTHHLIGKRKKKLSKREFVRQWNTSASTILFSG